MGGGEDGDEAGGEVGGTRGGVTAAAAGGRRPRRPAERARLLTTINRLKFLTGVSCIKSNSLLVLPRNSYLLTSC